MTYIIFTLWELEIILMLCRAESVSYQYIFHPILIFLPGPSSHISVELKTNVDYCVGIIKHCN